MVSYPVYIVRDSGVIYNITLISEYIKNLIKDGCLGVKSARDSY